MIDNEDIEMGDFLSTHTSSIIKAPVVEKKEVRFSIPEAEVVQVYAQGAEGIDEEVNGKVEEVVGEVADEVVGADEVPIAPKIKPESEEKEWDSETPKNQSKIDVSVSFRSKRF